MFICGGLAYLLCGGSQAMYSWVKAGGVVLGYLSHLVLDEIYSIEFASGRWRMKKSFGTSMKLWGDNHWANTAAYSKLALVGMTVLGEPSVMQHVAAYNPQLAAGITSLRSTVQTVAPNGIPTNGADVARAAINFFNGQSQDQGANPAMNGGWPQNPSSPQQQYPNTGAPQYANTSQQNYNNTQQQYYNGPQSQQQYANGQQANYNNGQAPIGNPPTDWPGPTQLNAPQQSGFNNSFNTAQRAGSNFPQ
jgi:hypothetical protein